MSSPHKLLSLLVCLVLVGITGALGAMASVDAKVFYASLSQPSWAPPPWLFSPVWTALYLMMALSLWRYGQSPGKQTWPQRLFLLQLGVNALWSWLFFSWHQGALAMLDVLALLVLIGACIRGFYPVSRLAAWLLVPYFAWVSFAALLTFSLWQGNSHLLG